MSLLRLYLKERWRPIAAFALFCGIFAVTFAMYHLPLQAVAYPAALCGVLGLVFLLLDFRRALLRHRRLSRIRSMTDLSPEALPSPQGIADADYQEIIRLLGEEQAAFRTGTQRRCDEMVDYYTTWAHQIKTPIAAMDLRLQSEDSPLSRALSSDLARIGQYVEMVMVFLRLDSQSTDYLIRRCPLDPIIRQAVKKFAGEFIARKLRLNYTPADALVLTDEKWLSFVIEQVLSNALKYTLAGSVSITLEPPMTLCIQDSGMGIAPEDLPRIFEKGYTGNLGRGDKKASGIGLYLCRRVCTNLGHTISVQSTPEVGTTVRIDLSHTSREFE